MSFIKPRIVDNGDAGLTIFYDQPTSEKLTRKIVTIDKEIRNSMGKSILDVIPSYQSITVIFSLLELSKRQAKKKLRDILKIPIEPSNYISKLLEIPVCYGGSYGSDLAYLGGHCHLSEKRIIQEHTQNEYLVHMLGFLPGFLYLGGLNESLFCPRKNRPELRIPKGSVGIGGNQTGIYPIESPGGWQIIGRTPVPLFDPARDTPAFASPLDRIRFVAISHSEFLALEQDYSASQR